MAQVTTAVKNVIAKALLPGIIKTKKAVVDWYKANQQWIRQKLGDLVRRLAEGIGRLVKLAVRVTGAFIDWAKSLDPVSAGFLKIAGIAAALALVLAMPAGSILLLIGLILLLIDDFLVWEEGGVSAIGAVDEALGGLLSAIRDGEVDIFNFGVAFDFWKTKAKEAVDYIVGQLERLPFVGAVTRALRAGAGVTGAITGGVGLREALRMVGAEEIARAYARGGVGAGAVARAAPGGGAQIVNAPRTNISIDVQARTDAPASEIAGQISRAFDEKMAMEYRGAMTGMLPAK